MKLITILLSILNDEKRHELVEKILDFVETKVLGSSTEIDDRVLLPIIEMLRKLIELVED